MELRDHSTLSLNDELARRKQAANSKDRRHAVAQTLRAVAFALEDDEIVVEGDRLNKVAEAAYQLAWHGMPGGSCRQTGYVSPRGQADKNHVESGMDLGWARVLNFRWPEHVSRWDVDKLLSEQRDAVLDLVRVGHGTRSSRAR